jgi:hypothetical protein
MIKPKNELSSLEKREYQTPVLRVYGDVLTLTRATTSLVGHNDGMPNKTV